MSSGRSTGTEQERLISFSQYQERIPGRTVVSSGDQMDEDFRLRSQVLPAEQEAISAPAIPQHVLTFVYADSIRGAGRIAGGPWQFFDTVARGHMTICPAGCSKALRWTTTDTVRTTSLYVAPQRLEEVGLQMGMAPSHVELPYCFNVADSELQGIAQTLRRIAAADMDDSLYLQTALQSIVVRLLRKHGTTAPPEQEETAGLSRARLRRTERYVRSHLDTDLSLDDLAQEVGLSKYYFARRFKERVGQSPYRFVIYERVRRARHLLRKTTRSLVRIALDVGFNSQSHFTRTFKRHVGVTPGAYRAAWW